MSNRAIELAPPPTLSPTDKGRLALELAELGISMKRRALQRADPEASDAVIRERLHRWLAKT